MSYSALRAVRTKALFVSEVVLYNKLVTNYFNLKTKDLELKQQF